MPNDLFITKEQGLKAWMKLRGYFSSVDLARYALDNYYLRAGRTARNLAEQGIIRRIPDDEAMFRGLAKSGNKRIAWWEYRMGG